MAEQLVKRQEMLAAKRERRLKTILEKSAKRSEKDKMEQMKLNSAFKLWEEPNESLIEGTLKILGGTKYDKWIEKWVVFDQVSEKISIFQNEKHYHKYASESEDSFSFSGCSCCIKRLPKDRRLCFVIRNDTQVYYFKSICEEATKQWLKRIKLLGIPERAQMSEKHCFVEHHFDRPTYCSWCTELIWGAVLKQGAYCPACESAVHFNCISVLSFECDEKA